MMSYYDYRNPRYFSH